MSLHTNNHLDPKTWNKVNRLYIKKAISEFSHELLIKPVLVERKDSWGVYELKSDDKEVTYQFNAQKLHFDHWYIDPDSIRKGTGGTLSLIAFIMEFKESLQIPEPMLPTYLEEISCTLYGAAYKYGGEWLTSAELANATFQQIEGAMIEGHPCFIANNGRIGFSVSDYHQYSPEASQGFKILWLAGHKDNAIFTSINTLSYEQLVEQELGKKQLKLFEGQLLERGLNPSDYYFFPMNPWQWENKLSYVFATDIATNQLVLLGEGEDTYQPQQSIRTLFNKSNPEKYYVKTALSIQNMGFMRGLSPYYMQSTPEITMWISDLLKEDQYLRSCGFSMLGEIATMGYINRNFEPMGRTNIYNKMLSVLWRESPLGYLKANQKPMTMAALLHVDPDGNALLPHLIQTSGKDEATWIRSYLSSYLAPLLHCFYAYDLVFMPHGENIILILEDNLPVGMFMKDITEEVVTFRPNENYPDKVQRLVVEAEDEVKVLSIATDVFDCFFRFLGQVIVAHCEMTERTFWELVADCIVTYQQLHPEFEEKYKSCDLFADSFIRSCLNRLQLNNHKQMVDLSNPVNGLQFIGRIDNPLATLHSVNA
ncbi:IucA/IucC family siderophore biosynthesis protein [Limibacter armeniacum]|uniref:IucA/IucC family protein n=1 Tax=Limibacter armeniacum TaxID=466084 RepID=UPI002FE5E856